MAMIQSIEKGRKEDGNRSIADKIIKRLRELEKTVENNQGRWAWELLQNAKDSIADDENRTVAVQVILGSNKIEFKHNGKHFSEQDIRGLINQISSKEVLEGEQIKKTGRFGTGFLTTHLLSKTIEVKGIVEAESSTLFSFQFPLDREGNTTPLLIPKIETAWQEFHKSAKNISKQYDTKAFNTSFSYILNTSEQKDIARIGVEEFIKLLPFVLAFISKIESVEIVNAENGKTIKFVNGKILNDDFIVTIKKIQNGLTENIPIALLTDKKAQIAVPLQKINGGYKVKSTSSIPKLFCDFPLIGTEKFHFPVIVNSFFFHPQTERDGIWLKGKKDGLDEEVNENQGIIVEAKNLFAQLLTKITSGNFYELYNIAETALPDVEEKYFDPDWYAAEIQRPIREMLWESNIVEVENRNEKKLLKEIYFPLKSYTNTNQQKAWQIIFDLFPESVSKKQHIEKWASVYWEECNKISYATLVVTISKRESLAKLAKVLNLDYSETINWLNNACQFINDDDANLSLFNKHAITPNQNGIFHKKDDLYVDEIEDQTLVEILKLLGDDWGDILLDRNIVYGNYHKKEKKNIAEKITEKLRSPKDNEETRRAIVLLSEWFEINNPDQSKVLFSELYRSRAELFMNTVSDKESLYKVMRSGTDLSELSRIAQTLAVHPELANDIHGAAQLSSLFNEFNISSIDELKEILRHKDDHSSGFQQIELTQEVLASLGVTSQEELEKALQDKHLASMFRHVSKPKVEMFVYAQGLIDRAKRNVMNYIQTLPVYDCSGMEELSTSVIGGVKKDGLSLHLVIRPSDFGQVIVYYDAEKDTLDYANAELWIENGKDQPKLLTLGKILKNTGINKIPV